MAEVRIMLNLIKMVNEEIKHLNGGRIKFYNENKWLITRLNQEFNRIAEYV